MLLRVDTDDHRDRGDGCGQAVEVGSNRLPGDAHPVVLGMVVEHQVIIVANSALSVEEQR